MSDKVFESKDDLVVGDEIKITFQKVFEIVTKQDIANELKVTGFDITKEKGLTFYIALIEELDKSRLVVPIDEVIECNRSSWNVKAKRTIAYIVNGRLMIKKVTIYSHLDQEADIWVALEAIT